MSFKKKLWLIFGPVIVAILILLVFLVSPFKLNVNKKILPGASISQSVDVFKGTAIKKAALEKNYVAFMGSSELSRIDPLHPSVLARKYHRSYRPFLLGAAGSQSLSHYWAMQGINRQLKNKKAVFIISPQWFVKKGIDPQAFAYYYSNLQVITWLKTADKSEMDIYAAKRLLQMKNLHSDSIIEDAVERIASGKTLTDIQKTYVDLKYNELSHEDQLFSVLHVNTRTSIIKRQMKQLPDTYNYSKLDKLAYDLGKKNTTNNPFEVDNVFWKKRLKGAYKNLKNEQSDFNYVSSPEYADFQLVLNQFAKNNTNVLFVIPPINKSWAKYTGLSMKMIATFDKKIKYQLKQQGFTNIVDMSKDGSEHYFMQDTIHLGWRGWLKLDKYVDPFLTKKQKTPKFKINNYFYSKNWQNLHGNSLNKVVD